MSDFAVGALWIKTSKEDEHFKYMKLIETKENGDMTFYLYNKDLLQYGKSTFNAKWYKSLDVFLKRYRIMTDAEVAKLFLEESPLVVI